MVANRGFQSTGARTRHRLIEAAYELLAEEGYPAFTARRIAARADLKPQLVHYYFRSMEDLVVTVFQRSSAAYFRLHDEALSSPRPLHALWELNCNLPEAKRMLEYVALGKQYPALRTEMRKSGESFRALQVEAIETIYALRKLDQPQIRPAALAVMMSAVARSLVIEEQVGLTSQHGEIRAVIEDYLDRLEP
ncbi:TetR/AcrR family transcriptional regulator [Novosphingobium album (ex Liu et al. 2023)]|uniref:Helix-turn-helix domain containing protein n=1 Tax=Novosphingobium album (ex Liu et al. 2023) TaxID=3031130 RepID=A0ABT5WXC3_9SPHN|nr:TetR/AcrR family transcriptional regulator [Novosphingobium album (ex Liu et al. 2023)]MDE8654556.1 helix-turn-helix domain containing protein [Novosphingobium album (ex Liu et al. 2023)]